MIGRRSLPVAVLGVLLQATVTTAQTGDNILLVGNALSPQSDEISSYYAGKRSIPNDQILRLPLPMDEEIDWPTYDNNIQAPIAQWLTTRGAQDRILYIVLTKDVPLRIAGTGGQNGTVASVDSELTVLYRRMTGVAVRTPGSVSNPYLASTAQPAAARFTHRTHDIYLVTRLDGYTVDDVKGLIDRGLEPSNQGVVVLDGKLGLTNTVGNRWLANAAAALKKLPGWSERVIADGGQRTLTDQSGVIGFYTWGSNAVAATERRFGHQFVPGAIAGQFVSTDARTFKEPPADWVVNDAKRPFGGSHQSLIGDLIRDGITGVAGHVAEPYLNGTIRPDLLFPAYAAGFNLAESFYMAMPFLSWKTVVVGDPLTAPFGPTPILPADLNPPLDEQAEMPQFFADRRLAALAATGATADAARWLAKGEVRSARRDRAGTREALEKATTIDPDYSPANMSLATLYEQAGEWDAAIARYQTVVAKNPQSATALNNLAYALAEHVGKPAEALPFAVRAYSLSVQDPTVGDTLAWIHHLMGDDSLAEPVITLAARRLPTVAEVQMHAAIILAGTGKNGPAAQALDLAIKLDASLTERADIKALQLRLRSAR